MAVLCAFFTILLSLVGSSVGSLASAEFGLVPDSVCRYDVWIHNRVDELTECALCNSCNVTDSQGTKLTLECSQCGAKRSNPVNSTKLATNQGFSWTFESDCKEGMCAWRFACESDTLNPRGYNCGNWTSKIEQVESSTVTYNSNSSSSCATCDYLVNKTLDTAGKIICTPCKNNASLKNMDYILIEVIANPLSINGAERRFYSDCRDPRASKANRDCNWCFSCIKSFPASGHYSCGFCSSNNLQSQAKPPGLNRDDLSLDDRVRIGFRMCMKCKNVGGTHLVCESCTNSKGLFEEPPISCTSELSTGQPAGTGSNSSIQHALTKCTDGLKMLTGLPQITTKYKLRMI